MAGDPTKESASRAQADHLPAGVQDRVIEIHQQIDDLMDRLDEILVQNKSLEQKRIRLLRRIAELKMEAETIARDQK